MSEKKTSKGELERLLKIEQMARDAAKASGVLRALDQAIQHGQRDVKDYGGAFDALSDMAGALEADLTSLADEINKEKWV